MSSIFDHSSFSNSKGALNVDFLIMRTRRSLFMIENLLKEHMHFLGILIEKATYHRHKVHSKFCNSPF